MTRRNALSLAPPYIVERSLVTLGANLRTARLRRNLTLQEMAEKIGVDRHVVSDAEKGKPSTSIAVYAAMLWVFGMAGQLSQVADPESDEEGKALESARAPKRARRERTLDDNF
ncbi:MAG: helix-turn-helix transcriptional regulator [Shinella sp.]|nr:helix-turn-helix transcriptional regulator [Shinella sp.]